MAASLKFLKSQKKSQYGNTKTYKGSDGKTLQIHFKDEEDEVDDDEINNIPQVIFQNSEGDSYRVPDINRTDDVPGRTVRWPGAGRDDATAASRSSRGEVKQTTEASASVEETVLLMKDGTDGEEHASMESLDLDPTNSRKVLIRTDSDLDLLLQQPTKWESSNPCLKLCCTSFYGCPPCRDYIKVIAAVVGGLIAYAIIVVIIIKFVGGV